MPLAEILERNRAFLAGHTPGPLPAPGSIAHLILACYDPRLDGLLAAALGLGDGHAFLVRSAGAAVTPTGDLLRSIALAVYLFDARAVTVVGHTSCRMAAFETTRFIDAFRARGVARDAFGAEDLRMWAGAIPDPRRGVQQSVAVLRAAPILPRDLEISGVLLDDATGALTVVVRPDEAVPGVAAPAGAGTAPEPETPHEAEAQAAPEPASPPAAPTPAAPEPARGAIPSPAPDLKRLIGATVSLVQTIESHATWQRAIRQLRTDLQAEKNPLTRARLIESFLRKAVADSREVAAAVEQVRQEAQGARVGLDDRLLVELLRRALMGEKL
jgi:carbonic anhydrase